MATLQLEKGHLTIRQHLGDRVVCDGSKERTKIEALTDNNLVNSLDSLAFSEDATSDRCPDMETSTTTVGQSFSTGTSASSTPLVGLKILDNM